VWDLSQATSLRLQLAEQAPREFPIRVSEASQRPHLVGGHRQHTFTLIKTPLYLGPPPLVHIPLVGRTSLNEELARWRLTLYNDEAAAPALNLRRVPLAELPPAAIRVEADYLELVLADPVLLGPTPLGNYTLRLRGPLGRDAELPLRLIPHLYVTGHEHFYVPDPRTGPPEIELLVETDPAITLEAQAEDQRSQVLPKPSAHHPGLYQVTVPPTLTEARLVAVKPTTGGGGHPGAAAHPPAPLALDFKGGYGPG
jgi:hypothetical protein